MSKSRQSLQKSNFSGGMNDYDDPREISDNELAYIYNMYVSKVGEIRVADEPASVTIDPSVGTVVGSDSGAEIPTPGYGMFVFGDDYDMPTGNGAISEDRQLYICDHSSVTPGNIRIFGDHTVGTTKSQAWADLFSIGTTPDPALVFYFADGALRVTDANFGANNNTTWFGRAIRTHWDCITIDPGYVKDAYNGWYDMAAEIVGPDYGLAGEYLFGVCATTGVTATHMKSTDFNAFPSTYDDDLDSGLYTALNTGFGVPGIGNTVLITSRYDNDELITEELATPTTWAGANYFILPPVGNGLTVYLQDSGAAGTWEAKPLEFACSNVYDGNQESKVHIMKGYFTPAASGGLQLIVGISGPYNPRVTGVRLYYRKYSATEGVHQWKLLMDVDFEKGYRTGIDGAFYKIHVVDNYTMNDGSTQVGDYFVVLYNGVVIVDPPTLTYEAINGFDQNETSLTAKYKCACVGNNRAWIGHVKVLNDAGNEIIYGDRIMYSPVGKYDTFPTSFYLEIMPADGDQITALAFYADRLLAFKENKVYIINVTNGGSSGWFIEDQVYHNGVNIPGAVFTSEIGVLWANKLGCFLFDGQRVINLILDQKTGQYKLDQATWSGYIQDDCVVGYDPIYRKVVVMHSASSSNGICYVCNLALGAWSLSSNYSGYGTKFSNFQTYYNQLVNLGQITNTVYTRKLGNDNGSKTSEQIQTKAEDWGDYSRIKKVYAFVFSYKLTTGKACNAILYYSVDGAAYVNTNVPSTTVSSSSTWNTFRCEFTSPIECGSIQFKFNLTDVNSFKLGSYTIEARPIHRSTT